MEERLIDRDESTVVIVREWVHPEEASSLCEKLKQEVPWTTGEVQVYGKLHMQPRRVYSCGDPGLVHQYAGYSINVDPWIPEIKMIRNRVEEETGVYFNSCLLNEYATGAEYIGFHSDKEAMGDNNTVVTISLGGSRDFHFKTKPPLDPETIKTTLHNGDACIMYGQTQKLFTHSIPKRAHAEYRISLTFRFLE